jgi:hypothetical protein
MCVRLAISVTLSRRKRHQFAVAKSPELALWFQIAPFLKPGVLQAKEETEHSLALNIYSAPCRRALSPTHLPS